MHINLSLLLLILICILCSFATQSAFSLFVKLFPSYFKGINAWFKNCPLWHRTKQVLWPWYEVGLHYSLLFDLLCGDILFNCPWNTKYFTTLSLQFMLALPQHHELLAFCLFKPTTFTYLVYLKVFCKPSIICFSLFRYIYNMKS